MGMSSKVANHNSDPTPSNPGWPADAGLQPDGRDEASAEGDPSAEQEDTSLADWIEAENSRPTLPDETEDGLNDLDEEVRRQAEDLRPDNFRR
jgi:hypothetical protein